MLLRVNFMIKDLKSNTFSFYFFPISLPIFNLRGCTFIITSAHFMLRRVDSNIKDVKSTLYLLFLSISLPSFILQGRILLYSRLCTSQTGEELRARQSYCTGGTMTQARMKDCRVSSTDSVRLLDLGSISISD